MLILEILSTFLIKAAITIDDFPKMKEHPPALLG